MRRKDEPSGKAIQPPLRPSRHLPWLVLLATLMAATAVTDVTHASPQTCPIGLTMIGGQEAYSALSTRSAPAHARLSRGLPALPFLPRSKNIQSSDCANVGRESLRLLDRDHALLQEQGTLPHGAVIPPPCGN